MGMLHGSQIQFEKLESGDKVSLNMLLSSAGILRVIFLNPKIKIIMLYSMPIFFSFPNLLVCRLYRRFTSL